MSTTMSEEAQLARELAEEFGLNLPLAAQMGVQYDVREAKRRAQEMRAANSGDAFSAVAMLAADITENGGYWHFPALFTLDGELIPARAESRPAGRVWLGVEELRAERFNESIALKIERRIKENRERGFYVGTVIAKASAEPGDDLQVAVAVREDGGWSREVIVVDSGIDS